MKPFGMTRTSGYVALTTARNSMEPSAWLKTSRITPILAHAEAEDRKLRKDPCLEVLALKVPFGKLLLRRSRITSRGRDNLKA
jgi:hypothetical protein